MVLLATLGLPMWLIPDLVLSGFLHDPATRELAQWPLRVIGLTMAIEALGFAFMNGMLGAGDARRVMLVSIVVQWLLFLPLAYVIGPVLGLGLTGVWVWQAVTRGLQAWVYVTMWRGRKWQHIH